MTTREKFQKSPHARGWIEIADGQQFQAAADAAMLIYQSEFLLANDMGTAASNEWRRQGAKRFLEILTTLTLPPPKEQKAARGQELDHKV